MIGYTVNYQPRPGRLVDSVEILLGQYDHQGYQCERCGSRRAQREHLLILKTGEPERHLFRCTNVDQCLRRRRS